MGVYKGEVSCIYIYIQTGLYRALFSTTERKCRLQAEVTFSHIMYKSLYYMRDQTKLKQPYTPKH